MGLVVIALLLSLSWSARSRDTLNLMLITSGGGQYNSSGAQPAIDLAVNIINENDIIPGYDLVIETRGDSNCERQIGLTSFLKNISAGNDKLALIGCGCSIATVAVAEISWIWNITHISFSSSVETLNNRDLYPNFWRTHPSEANLADAVLAIMNEYLWNKIKIITQDESLFAGSTARITEMLLSENKTVITDGTTLFKSSQNVSSDENFYLPEIRIYFLNMYSIHARRLLCNAVLLQQRNEAEFYVPGYVWITLGWYGDNWWTETVAQDSLPECSDNSLKQLLLQSVAIQELNLALDLTAPTDVNLTAQEFKERYLADVNEMGYFFEPTAFYAYDAMWALAFAFNRSIDAISDQNFSYAAGTNISLYVHNELMRTAFNGVSGFVSFNENGTRPHAVLQIKKYRKGNAEGTIERVLVGFENGTTLKFVNNESKESIWQNGIPLDGTPINATVPIILPLAVTYYILATAGNTFAVVCLLFNIVFRKRKIVRLISPNLNYIIISGGILLYSSVYWYTISTTDSTILNVTCHIRYWFQVIGYFLCFGTIVAKMWRVFYLFHNPTMKKKRVPKDWHLVLIVAAMCSGVIIIGIAVAIFGDYKAEIEEDNERPEARNSTNQVQIKYYNLVCGGPASSIWILILLAYIFLTQVMAVILAFRTRKVTIKALNDSKQLTIIIYLSTIIITVMVICVPALNRFLNADAAVFGGLIMIFTTVVLALMFIPKMVMLYKDPHGEKIFDRGQTQLTLNNTGADEFKIENYDELEKHCRNLEVRLKKHEDVVPFQRSSSVRRQSLSGGTRSISLSTQPIIAKSVQGADSKI